MASRFFILCLCFPIFSVSAESFVQPRKRRPQEIKALREDVCKKFADLNSVEPQLMRALADVHELSVDCLGEFVQGERNGLIARANKDQLTQLYQLLEECQKSIAATVKKCKSVFNVGRSLAQP